MKSKRMVWISAIVLVVAVVVGLFVYCGSSNRVFDSKRFDRNVWISSGVTDNNGATRIKMVDDLTGNYLKKGTSRQTVVHLLGRPSWKERDELGYSLGSGDGFFSSRPYYLFIHFDAANRLKSLEVTQK